MEGEEAQQEEEEAEEGEEAEKNPLEGCAEARREEHGVGGGCLQSAATKEAACAAARPGVACGSARCSWRNSPLGEAGGQARDSCKGNGSRSA